MQNLLNSIPISSVEYNYTARVILLAEAAQDQKSIQKGLDVLLSKDGSRETEIEYILNGICTQFGPFVLIEVEGRINLISDFLQNLQIKVQRWANLDQQHPHCLQTKSETPLLKRTVVLLFEENVRPLIITYRHAAMNLIKTDVSLQQTLQQQVNHTTASVLKMVSVANLALATSQIVLPNGVVQSAQQDLSAILQQLHEELPNMQNLSKILQLPEQEGNMTKTSQSLNTYETLNKMSQDQCNKIVNLEEKHDQFIKEESSIFKTAADGIMELDEFINLLINGDKYELVEEVGNLNENWIYLNLKHILEK